jgi:hypothetical protein
MSWTTLPVSEADVRAYLDVSGTTGTYSTALIASNIRAAASFLEKATGRQFEAQTGVTKTFTSNGAAAVAIPDARTITSVTMQGAALDLDESYWEIEDDRGAITTIQLRPYGTGRYPHWLANPDWYDRNLDRYGWYTSLPNDLVIVGDFGYSPLPHDFLLAVKALAGWYTRRPASLLGNTLLTPEGNQIDYSQLPVEVQTFIANWAHAGNQMVAV